MQRWRVIILLAGALPPPAASAQGPNLPEAVATPGAMPSVRVTARGVEITVDGAHGSLSPAPGADARVRVEATDHGVFARVDAPEGTRFHHFARRGPQLRQTAVSRPVRASADVEIVPRIEGDRIVLRTSTTGACGVAFHDFDASQVGAEAVPLAPTSTGSVYDATVTRVDAPGESWFLLRNPVAPLAVSALRLRGSAALARPSVTLASRAGEALALTPSSEPETFGIPGDLDCVTLLVRYEGPSAPLSVEAALSYDPPEAIERIVGSLAEEGVRAEAAIATLARLGPAALPSLEASYAEATVAERARMLRAAERMVSTAPNALRLFVLAVEGEDADLRELALQRLVALGAPGQRALAVALSRGAMVAAAPLAERNPVLAMEVLAERLSAADDAERRTLHAAVRAATRRSAEARGLALAFARSDAPVESRAMVAASVAEVDRDAVAPVAAAFESAEAPAEVQVRFLELLAAMPVEAARAYGAALDRARTSELWMVRDATLPVFDRLGDREALRSFLDDATPRVRAHAIALLSGDGPALERIAALSRRDEWPRVRLAGTLALLDVEEARGVVGLALRDRSTRVRRGLYEALAARNDARFVDSAVATLTARRARTEVLLAAIGYVDATCAREAREALRALVERGLGSADERRQQLGMRAATALAHLGDAEDVELVERMLGAAPAGARQARCDASAAPRR